MTAVTAEIRELLVGAGFRERTSHGHGQPGVFDIWDEAHNSPRGMDTYICFEFRNPHYSLGGCGGFAYEMGDNYHPTTDPVQFTREFIEVARHWAAGNNAWPGADRLLSRAATAV